MESERTSNRRFEAGEKSARWDVNVAVARGCLGVIYLPLYPSKPAQLGPFRVRPGAPEKTAFGRFCRSTGPTERALPVIARLPA